MSWGPDGYGLPLPLFPVDEATYIQYLEDHGEDLIFQTRSLVDAQDQPAADAFMGFRHDGQEVTKRITHMDPARETEYWVADPPV